ncbi:MAG: trypsin-like peptidase domain-containing protein [Candidatus Nanopelagicales bacterium]
MSTARVRLRARAVVGTLFAALVCLAPGPALADAPPTSPLEEVQALVQPAVVYEEVTWTGYVYDETNKQYFTNDPFTASFQCTGFVVNPDGYVATAGHCVDYDQTIREAILTQVVDWAYNNDYYEVSPSKETIATFAKNWRIDGAKTEGTPDLAVNVAYGVSVSGEPSGKALPARVIAKRAFDQGDVALLKIEARDLTVVPLSDNADTGVGTEIVSVGYPASVDLVTDANFNPSFKEGTISAEKTTSGGLLPVYEISAAVSGGMSGGPTVGLDGDVIGVNSFKIEGETQPFNFVQPSQNLQELMRGEGVENTLGKVTDLYRAGLNAYFAGDREEAISDFQQVLDIVPSHQFAQEYLRKSQDLPKSSGLLSSPLLWIGLLLVALVVAAIVIAVVVSRRRKPAAVTAGGAGLTPPPPPAAASADQTPPPPPAAATPEPEPAPPTEVLPPPEQPPPAAASGAEDRFCPNCGNAHEADDRFCPKCGHPLH